MTRVILAVLIAVFAASSAFAEAKYPGEFVVTADTLNVRLQANTSGKLIDRLVQREKVEVLEVKDGWARLSEYRGGEAESGSVGAARWVFAMHLSPATSTPSAPPKEMKIAEGVPIIAAMTSADELAKYQDSLAVDRPEQRIDVSSPIVAAIKASEDLGKHLDTFVLVSGKLVNAGECELSDFEDIGGWWRSVDHRPRPIYYTYCGGASNNHRVFVNVDTGRVFK